VVKANYTFMVPNRGSPPGEIVVGPALERSRGLAKNNGISFRSYSGKLHSFTIAEVLPHDSELVSADLVLMSEADFRAFFDYPAAISPTSRCRSPIRSRCATSR
jgi:hypothetical protein